MKYVYFVGCKDVEEVKTKYKQLVKQHHPDMPTGNHNAFVVLKQEFDHILEGRSLFPIGNLHTHGEAREPVYTTNEADVETITNLSPEELLKKRAEVFFNNLRKGDVTFDQIDAIIEEAAEEGSPALWVYQEVQKLDDLTIDHFKYLTFKLDHPVSNAHLFFKKYRLMKVL